jgi:hypothetical protein
MSELPVYSFFPWLRQGLGNQITADDFNAAIQLRAAIPVTLQLTGTGLGANLASPITHTIPLAGPGDIVGISSRAVVRTDPRNWITNFEPNYIPFIEFYDEDFPWRYTPAKPNTATHRLRPWIALVVLEETEFGNGANTTERPLPFIVIEDPSVFPAADQLWAWAHVHVNRGMIDAGMRLPSLTAAQPVSPDAITPAVQRLANTIDENADLAYSRIVCPRKLKDNTAYHAFVVPVFESGRLAGLGLDPADAPNATASAWAAYATRKEAKNYPYYYRWYFKTGSVGDFEYLVRLLKPRTVDKRVGTRDLDVQKPGANLPGIDDPVLAGVLKLGGALKVPRATLSTSDLVVVDRYENWAQPYPTAFQKKLAALINLADDYSATTAAAANASAPLGAAVAGEDDPLITPPLYGRWHALTDRLLSQRDGTGVMPNDNWVHQLNLDPRHRVTAGFGTRVVQQQQEDLMDAAWRQVGDVLDAQRRIRDGQLIKQVAWIWHAKHIKPLHEANPERAFSLAAPVHGRVLEGGTTIAYQVKRSALPASAISAPVRRVLRPRGRIERTLPLNEPGKPQTFLRRLNSKEVSAAPPREKPAGLVTPTDVAGKLRDAVPAFLVSALRKMPWLPLLLLLLTVLIALLVLWLMAPAGTTIAIVVVAIGLALFTLLQHWARVVRRADAIDDRVATPADVDDLPHSPGFTIVEPGQDPSPATGATDSVQAQRFKTGVRQARTLIAATVAAADKAAEAEGPHAPIRFGYIARTVVNGINPDVTVPRRTLAGIKLPPRLAPLVVEEFLEPFAYPVFDMPMYKPLTDISSELFLPNLDLIEQNSVTLLETNQPFIEAYMAGLNHEFARELLWREYPTDQRGSCFRQFWDVSVYLDPNPSPTAEAQKEKLRDIPPLHRWSRTSKLGDHDHREVGGAKEDEVVLTVRGELLKKYPNAVIYAHRARWQTTQSGGIDNTKERQLETLTAAEEDTPPRSKVRAPLYEAKVDPDIYFFGFDLTAEAARGGTGENAGDDPGWFFVIKERPGEPRFGFDVTKNANINVWNDLAWDDVLPAAAGNGYVSIDNAMTAIQVVAPTAVEDQEKVEQHGDDVAIKWDKDMNAADVAYVLYQAPVMVAIHAAEMLRREGE